MKVTVELSADQVQELELCGVSDVTITYKRAEKPIVTTSSEAAKLFSNLRNKKQEYFCVATLDGANRVITKRTVSVGTLTGAMVHPREVFAGALQDRAAGIIVAHNHPSGSLNPSTADLETMNRLRDAGRLLGINVLDCLIITKSDFTAIND